MSSGTIMQSIKDESLQLIFFDSVSNIQVRMIHHPFYYELILFLQDNTVIMLNGKEAVCYANDIMLLSPSDECALKQRESKCCVVRIKADVLETLSTQKTDLRKLFAEIKAPENYGETFIKKVVDVFKEINKAKYFDGFGNDTLCYIGFVGLLLDIYNMRHNDSSEEYCPSGRAVNANNMACSVMDYIDHNYTDPELCLKKVASDLFISVSYLSHVFKKETGDSVYKYLTKKRVEHAHYLVRQGISVNEACHKSGFRSYYGFYRAYLKNYGVAPTCSVEKI